MEPLEVSEESSKREGEAKASWRWVETCIWTPRMLETLERGVKGGKWFSLIDKVYESENLRRAFKRVKYNQGAAGVDHVKPGDFEERLEENLNRLRERLKTETYTPSAIRRVHIPKLGSKESRPLGIPTVADRVVQTALRQAIEPIFEREFKESSYGFRPKRNSKEALRAVTRGIDKEGHRWVVDADIKQFFEHIDHEILMRLVERRISDGRVLELIRAMLKQGVNEGTEYWEPDQGTPQGGTISPLLANIYLHEVDKIMEGKHRLIRYADDLVILCKSEQEATEALELLRSKLDELKLSLHPEKTRIVDLNVPRARFTFLGYDFVVTTRDKHMRRYPSKKSRTKLRERIRRLTKRTNGNSLTTIAKKVNQVTKGWFEYFKHSSKAGLENEDQWIRSRLRAILAKRQHHKGRGHGISHFRWPVRYFDSLGLFNMERERAMLLQSA